MENASKALIIVGAILISILLIGIGMVVITSSTSTMNESLQAMSTQEKEAFNAQFETFQGEEVSGSNVKSLLSKLAANFSTYVDEPAKVPEVNADLEDGAFTAEYLDINEASPYPQAISDMRNALTNKHTYEVTMNFGAEGVIDSIDIRDITIGG